MYGIVCAGKRHKQWADDPVRYGIWGLQDGKVNPNYGIVDGYWPTVAEAESVIQKHYMVSKWQLVTEDQFREEAYNRKMIVKDLFVGLAATSVEYIFVQDSVPD